MEFDVIRCFPVGGCIESSPSPSSSSQRCLFCKLTYISQREIFEKVLLLNYDFTNCARYCVNIKDDKLDEPKWASKWAQNGHIWTGKWAPLSDHTTLMDHSQDHQGYTIFLRHFFCFFPEQILRVFLAFVYSTLS